MFLCYEARTVDMIHIKTFTFNEFQVNTYVLWDDEGRCLVIDPAFYHPGEQQELEQFLDDKGLTVTGQANTHCHVDHILGIRYIRERHGVPFRAHQGELPVIQHTHVMADMFGWSMEPMDSIDETIEEGDVVLVGEQELKVLPVPGHSPGSVAFYSAGSGFVVTGDALFQNSIGRTDLPGGDHDTLIHSIRQNLMSLPPETVVYPGHGPSTTIGDEKENNPFLRAAE